MRHIALLLIACVLMSASAHAQIKTRVDLDLAGHALTNVSSVTGSSGGSVPLVNPTINNTATFLDNTAPSGALGSLVRAGSELSFGLSSSSATFLEQVNRKNAANGYAGLDVSGKLNLVLMQEVMNVADLADVSGTTGIGSTLVFSSAPTISNPTINGTATFADNAAPAAAAGGLTRNGAELSFGRAGTASNLELVARKDAASGYAGLTASTKLNLAQMQEVMGFADLSDISGSTGSGSTIVLQTSPALTTPTMTNPTVANTLTFTDNAAAVADAGGLARNGAELSFGRSGTASNIELVARKDAASGYAGLTASTKLNLTQGQEVWSFNDLSDATVTSAAAYDLLVRNSGNTAWVNQAKGANSTVWQITSGGVGQYGTVTDGMMAALTLTTASMAASVTNRLNPIPATIGSIPYDAGTGNPYAELAPTDGYYPKLVSGAAPVADNPMPTGAIIAYGGPVAPPLWLKCDGSSLSRTGTYANLCSALLKTSTITLTIANPCVITWTGHTFSDGDSVVFTTTGTLPANIVSGTTYYMKTVTSSDTFNIAATPGGAAISTATQSQSGTHTGTVAPWGFVDSTHFSLPDLRGRGIHGKDNMSNTAPFTGTAQNRITNSASSVYGIQLGAGGGSETHVLTVAELASHNHTQNSHNHTQDTHNHTQNSHNHTQDSHSHTTSALQNQTGTLLATGSAFAVTTNSISSSTVTATNQATTATNQTTVATNQATTATNNSAGGDGAHTILDPTVIANYIIKY